MCLHPVLVDLVNGVGVEGLICGGTKCRGGMLQVSRNLSPILIGYRTAYISQAAIGGREKDGACKICSDIIYPSPPFALIIT